MAQLYAYNLTSIATYAGWDAFRGGQSYTVSVATAAAPATFITLANEDNNAQGGGNVNTRAVITPLSGLLAANVTAVRFDFGSDLTPWLCRVPGDRRVRRAGPRTGRLGADDRGVHLIGIAVRGRTRTVAA